MVSTPKVPSNSTFQSGRGGLECQLLVDRQVVAQLVGDWAFGHDRAPLIDVGVMGRMLVGDDDVVGVGGGIGVERDNQAPNRLSAPTIWATMKPGAEPGAMPAKVSENIRPTVTAGLAIIWTEVKDGPPPV